MAESLSSIRRAFRFDTAASRFRGPNGRFINAAKLKAGLVSYSRRAGRELQTLAERMSRGEMTIEGWQEQTAAQIKNLHIAMAAAGRGGFERLTNADNGRIGARLRYQYRKLQGFAEDVQAGRLSPAQIVARSKLYAASANGTYERFVQENWNDKAAAGVIVQMANVLGFAEHCGSKGGEIGCLDETDRGWVPLGEMSSPGSRRCKSNCHCHLKYRKVKPKKSRT